MLSLHTAGAGAVDLIGSACPGVGPTGGAGRRGGIAAWRNIGMRGAHAATIRALMNR
jgi:hypothetical protein